MHDPQCALVLMFVSQPTVLSQSSYPLVHEKPHVPVQVGVPLAPLSQSLGALHVFPAAHFGQSAPPQSMSVSPPFFKPSLQLATTQTPLAEQTGLEASVQSVFSRQPMQFPFPSQTLPPSVHAAPAWAASEPQTFATHELTLQVWGGQSVAALHSTHLPAAIPFAAPQTWPPSNAHAPATGVCIGVVPLQPPLLQASLSSGLSSTSTPVLVAPAPSHSTTEQSFSIWAVAASGVPSATGRTVQQPA